MKRRSCRIQIRKNSESEREECEERESDGKANTKITTPVPKEIITSPVRSRDSKKVEEDDDDFERVVKKRTTPRMRSGHKKKKNDDDDVDLSTEDDDDELENKITASGRSSHKKACDEEQLFIREDDDLEIKITMSKRSSRKKGCKDDSQLSAQEDQVEGEDVNAKSSRSSRKKPSDEEQLSTEENDTNFEKKIKTAFRISRRKINEEAQYIYSTEEEEDTPLETLKKSKSTPSRSTRKMKNEKTKLPTLEENTVLETRITKKQISTPVRSNRKKPSHEEELPPDDEDVSDSTVKKRVATPARSYRKTRSSDDEQLPTEDEEDAIDTTLKKWSTTPARSSRKRRQSDDLSAVEDGDVFGTNSKKIITYMRSNGKKRNSGVQPPTEEVEEEKEEEKEIEDEKNDESGDVEEKEEEVVNVSGSDEIGLSETLDRTKNTQNNKMLHDSQDIFLVAQDVNVEDVSVHGGGDEDKNAAVAADADHQDVADNEKEVIDEDVADEKGDVTDDDEDGGDDEDGADDNEDGADDDEDVADNEKEVVDVTDEKGDLTDDDEDGVDDDEDGADDNEDGSDDDDSDVGNEDESADNNEAIAEDRTEAEPPSPSVIENPIPLNVISCPKPPKRTFNIDRSKYENGLFNKFGSNPLMQSMCELKNNNLFKDFMRTKRTNTKEKDDVLSLDSVTLSNETPSRNDKFKLSSSIQTSVKHDLYIDTTTGKSNQIDTNKNVEKLVKKSVLADDLESMERAPKLFKSRNSIKVQSKKERDETAGKGWYNLPKTEVTDKIKNDLQLLKMRNVLDSKHHYKRNDTNKLPKYFQMGTIVEGAHEFYSARVPKKKRKGAMVDELLADAEFRRKNKQKYIEIRKKQMSGGKGFYKKQKNKGKKTWERT